MGIRRLTASGVAIGLLFASALPVAADHPTPGPNRYVVTTLVTGPSPDPDLVNGWGLSRGPSTPWWVSDNGTGVSTLYLADGTKLVAPRVTIPGGAPTGTVFNGGAAAGDFNGDPFLFASEAGIISAWRGALGATAEIGNNAFAGDAVFKGLAIGTADVGHGSQQYLFATDFHNRRVVVFDRTFAPQTWPGAFHDPKLPKVYAPFGIQNLNGMIFVTFAKTQPGSADEQAGEGRGFVDAFRTNGTFLGRVATRDELNAPWGLAWAPSGFGSFSGDLIVGNFGDGNLLAYRWNGHHWHFAGKLRGANHRPIVVDGLWGIAFGGGIDLVKDGPATTLFFAAGPNHEAGGAFGTITVASH
jgi:uncharacterized protein (TIGR03118 family)